MKSKRLLGVFYSVSSNRFATVRFPLPCGSPGKSISFVRGCVVVVILFPHGLKLESLTSVWRWRNDPHAGCAVGLGTRFSGCFQRFIAHNSVTYKGVDIWRNVCVFQCIHTKGAFIALSETKRMF